MNEITVNSQAELDKAAKLTDMLIRPGKGYYNVEKLGDGSRVYAYDGSRVYAKAGARVDAKAGSMVYAYDGSMVDAKAGSMVDTPEKWCVFFDVEVCDGVAVIYKGTDNDFRSPHGVSYAPGTIPKADDWDGGKDECGGGLHFSPKPGWTRAYNCNAKHYVACPVRLSDMRPPKSSDNYPDKIKASGCCAPVWGCDVEGKPIMQETPANA